MEPPKETRSMRVMTADERARIETKRGELVAAGVGTDALLRARGVRIVKPALVAAAAGFALHVIGLEAIARLVLMVTAAVSVVSLCALAGMSLMLSRLAVRTVEALSLGYDRDLAAGEVAVEPHRVVRALAVTGGPDELPDPGDEPGVAAPGAPSWLLELADGRVLFVHASVPVLGGAPLPADAVEIVRGVDTEVCLGVQARGAPLPVERTLPPLDYNTVLDLAPVSLLPGPLSETLAELTAPVDSDDGV